TNSATGVLPAAGSLLAKIAKAPLADNMKSDLHPLTKHVLTTALDKLTTGGTQYMNVKGSTLTRGSTTKAAQQYVKEGYKILSGLCQKGDPLLDGKALIFEIKKLLP
ncbi:MAG: hypothetical protein QX189_03215, partial [Methylococcales bacterium]